MAGHRRKAARTVSPLLRQLVDIVDTSGMTYCQVCTRAGVGQHAISTWKHGKVSPTMPAVEAMLQSLGYRLEIVPLKPDVDEAVTITYVIDGT